MGYRTIIARYLREAKPGGFQTGGFPLFSGKVQIVSRTLSGLFLVGAVDRPRKRKGTNRENPRTIPSKSGKSRKNRESPKKGKKGQKRKDKSRSGNPPCLKPPPFSGPWDIYVAKWGIARMCLCKIKYQEGGVAPFGGVLTSLKKYRTIWGH